MVIRSVMACSWLWSIRLWRLGPMASPSLAAERGRLVGERRRPRSIPQPAFASPDRSPRRSPPTTAPERPQVARCRQPHLPRQRLRQAGEGVTLAAPVQPVVVDDWRLQFGRSRVDQARARRNARLAEPLARPPAIVLSWLARFGRWDRQGGGDQWRRLSRVVGRSKS